jgi:hypothetical protein
MKDQRELTVSSSSQRIGVKIILEGKETCRRFRKSPNEYNYDSCYARKETMIWELFFVFFPSSLKILYSSFANDVDVFNHQKINRFSFISIF